MLSRAVDGRVLTFHLAGINNQNFLMRDEETGTFWQQIDGRAVSGPLAGSRLQPVRCDELTFAQWRLENPQGMVLRPLPKYQEHYETRDWERRIGRAPAVVDTSSTGIPPRQTMLGIVVGGAARAYRLERVLEQKLVQDRVGGQPVILVVAPDGKSVRCFLAQIPGQDAAPDFYRQVAPAATGASSATDPLLIDGAAGSGWDFQGCAVSGPAKGACLPHVEMIKDYWFDWHIYHPQTTVYNR